jgi:hypothetical protein
MYVIFVSVEKVSWTVRNDSEMIVVLQIMGDLLLILQVKRRFSDFLDLQNEIETIDVSCNLPSLPPKVRPTL